MIRKTVWELGRLMLVALAGIGALTLVTLAVLAWRLR